MKISNKTYDILKYIAQYVLPAIGTLYFALAGIWGLPYGEQIVGTVAALDTFLGVILGLSQAKYAQTGDGTLLIDTSDPTRDLYHLDVAIPLEDIKNKSSIMLKVDPRAKLS